MKVPFSDYTLGAGVATDLVNTSALVRRSTGEMLVNPAALARFLSGLGLETLRHTEPTAGDLDQVLELRNGVRCLLEADTVDDVVTGANALVGQAATGPVLERDDTGRWQWYVTTASDASLAAELAVVIGLGLLGVLRTLKHDRIRHCASPVCDGMFIDTSKAGRRRYCMPDVCGNRINVANYRARHLAAEDQLGLDG